MIKPKSKPKKLINLENCMKTIHEEKKAAMIKLQPKISSQIGWEARLAGRPGWPGGQVGREARLAGRPDWIILHPSLSQ